MNLMVTAGGVRGQVGILRGRFLRVRGVARRLWGSCGARRRRLRGPG